jgi:hypothetical protein
LPTKSSIFGPMISILPLDSDVIKPPTMEPTGGSVALTVNSAASTVPRFIVRPRQGNCLPIVPRPRTVKFVISSIGSRPTPT